jgi:hypothetical protein
MECVTPVRHDRMMELLMNLAAGLSGLILAVVGLYSVVAIWSDDLP